MILNKVKLMLICIASVLLFARASNAGDVWLSEISEVKDAEITATFNMRYLAQTHHIYYHIQLTNHIPIYYPPLEDSSRKPYLGIEPFYDMDIKIDGKWFPWVRNKRLSGWSQHKEGLYYMTIFSRALDINGKPPELRPGADGIQIWNIPSWPQAIKLTLPYKKSLDDPTENVATFILQQKNLSEYQEILNKPSH